MRFSALANTAGVNFHSFTKQIFGHKLWSGSKRFAKIWKNGSISFYARPGSTQRQQYTIWRTLLKTYFGDQGSLKWMLNTHLDHRFYYVTVTVAFHTLSLFIVKLTTLWVSEAFAESTSTAFFGSSHHSRRCRDELVLFRNMHEERKSYGQDAETWRSTQTLWTWKYDGEFVTCSLCANTLVYR